MTKAVLDAVLHLLRCWSPAPVCQAFQTSGFMSVNQVLREMPILWDMQGGDEGWGD